jgi:hypothetical protein
MFREKSNDPSRVYATFRRLIEANRASRRAIASKVTRERVEDADAQPLPADSGLVKLCEESNVREGQHHWRPMAGERLVGQTTSGHRRLDH